MSVIEQITYLLFARRLDELHTAREKQANLLKKPIGPHRHDAGSSWSILLKYYRPCVRRSVCVRR